MRIKTAIGGLIVVACLLSMWFGLRTRLTSEFAPKKSVKAYSPKDISPRVPSLKDGISVSTLPAITAAVPSSHWLDRVAAITLDDEKAHADDQHRRIAQSRIQRVVERFGVDPSKVKELEGLLVEREHLGAEVDELMSNEKGEIASTWIKSFSRAESERIDRAISQILGAENMKSFTQMVDGLGSRLYAIEFFGEAYANGIPVSISDQDKINALLSSVDRRELSLKRNDLPDPKTGLNAYDARVIQALGTFLTPQQLRVFTDIKQESRAYSLARQIRRAEHAKQTK